MFINVRKREVTLVGCENKDSCYSSFISVIRDLINKGHRVIIPTNMGEKWINCVVGNVGNPKFGIYSKNQQNNKVSEDINEFSIISEEIVLIFITTLGNVGIDINNTDKPTTMVVYTDNKNLITGQFIEQYANRFRKIFVDIFIFFINPNDAEYENEFGFNYIENPNEIALIGNSINTNFYEDQEYIDMIDEDFKVDTEKVRWKSLYEKLQHHNTNIIIVGGYLKSIGYDVTISEGDEKDEAIMETYKELFKEQKMLEYECKIRALDFMLTDVLNLISNINNHNFKMGEYSLTDKTLTLENEQIFRSVRALVKKCVQISGFANDFKWIKTFMIDSAMNFRDIEARLKYMYYVNSDKVDDLDNNLVDEVDKEVSMIDGKGTLSGKQYQNLLVNLTPKYINKAYNNANQITKEKLHKKLKTKLDVCYIIKIGKKEVVFNQRYTEVWINQTITWFESYNFKLETKVPVNNKIARNENRKGQAIGNAIGNAVGLNIGKAYEHITTETILKINEIVENAGLITAPNIIEITGLTSRSLGGFVKAKYGNLTPKPKMINGVRETWYYK